MMYLDGDSNGFGKVEGQWLERDTKRANIYRSERTKNTNKSDVPRQRQWQGYES